MKSSFFFAILLFWGTMCSQKSDRFYFEPTITKKIYTTSSEIPPPYVTEYFNIYPKRIITGSGIRIGLNLGFIFENNDQFQFGFSQDDILHGIDAHFNSVATFTPNTLSGLNYFSLYTGVSCTNYSLLYKYCFFNNANKNSGSDRFIKAYLKAGISYFYKPNNGIEVLSGPDGFSYITSDSSQVYIEATPYNIPVAFKNSFKWNTGIEFSFGKKETEYFTLSISYISNKTGLSSRKDGAFFSYLDVQATVISRGQKVFYSYHVKGTGNGIYLTISKKIYPFRILHKRYARKAALIKKIEQKNL